MYVSHEGRACVPAPLRSLPLPLMLPLSSLAHVWVFVCAYALALPLARAVLALYRITCDLARVLPLPARGGQGFVYVCGV